MFYMWGLYKVIDYITWDQKKVRNMLNSLNSVNMKSKRLNSLNKKCEKLVLVSKMTLTKTNDDRINIMTNVQNPGQP